MSDRQALPADAAARKAIPIYSGCVRYFPDALAAVADLSRKGNEQHNPGKPLHWDRSKSGDELDALTRHLVDAGTIDTDGVRHSAKVAWRALANLQKEIERDAIAPSKPYPPRAKTGKCAYKCHTGGTCGTCGGSWKTGEIHPGFCRFV